MITKIFNLNGRYSKLTVDYPGELINSSTTDVMADLNGNIVKDISKASYRVMVGVGYTIMESKNDSNFSLIIQGKQEIKRSSKVSTTGESLTVYEPLPLPRSQPSITVDPVKKVVVVSIK